MAMLIFQYEISAFNKDLHISISEVDLFKELKEHITEVREIELTGKILEEEYTILEEEENAAEEAERAK